MTRTRTSSEGAGADGGDERARLDRLVAVTRVCEELELSAKELFWLISVKQLPGWLVGGAWKFDLDDVRAWATANGGEEEVRRFVRDAIEKHRRARAEIAEQGLSRPLPDAVPAPGDQPSISSKPTTSTVTSK